MGQRANALTRVAWKTTARASVLFLAACGAPAEQRSGKARAEPLDPFEGLPPLAWVEDPATPPAKGGPALPSRVDQRLPALGPDAPAVSRPQELRVVCHPPLDGDPTGAIAYVFNQPMWDPEAGKTPPPDLIRVTPPTPGQSAWLGDRTLVFTPQDRFRFATAYQAVLRPDLVSLSGRRLRAKVTTGFTTRTPSLVETRPPPGEVVDPWPVFSLRFNQPVDPAAVLAHLSLEGPGAPALRLDPRLGAEPQVVRVEPTTPLTPSAAFRLRLAPGLTSTEGPLHSEQTLDVPFSVIGPQRLVEARCPQAPCLPGDVVQLTVDGERPTERTCQVLEVTPPPRELRCEARGNALLVSGRFLPGGLYLVRLEGDDPEVPPIPLPVGRHRQPPKLAPDRPLLVVRPGAPVPLAASWAITGARAAKIRPEMVAPVLQAIAAPDSLAPFGLAEEPPRALALIREGEGRAALDLPSLGDAAPGTLWLVSLEGPPPLASPPSRGVALVQVTALGLTVRYGWKSGVALVTWTDGAARPKAALVLRDRHGAPIWRGETNAEGLARLPGQRRPRGAPPYTLWAEDRRDRTFVVLDGGGEDGHGVPGYLPGQSRPSLERLVGTVRTDRRRYLPGAQVRLFGVLRGQTRLPLGTIGHLPARHREIGFRVTGPRDEEIASGHAALQAAGLFSAAFALPAHSAPGRYTLWISLASADRSLTDWVRGRFQVLRPGSGLHLAVGSPVPEPRLGLTSALTLSLAGLGDSAVAGASLRWQLYRQRGAAPPEGFTGFRFGAGGEVPARSRRAASLALAEATWVAEGQGLTDAAGELGIAPKMTAPGQTDRATYELIVDAETLDGRHLRRSRRLTALRLPTQLGLRSDRPVVLPGQPVEALVVALAVSGAPVPAGVVTVEARRDGGGPDGPSCEVFLGSAADSCLLTLPAQGRWTLLARHPDALSASASVIQAGSDPTAQGGRGPLELLPAQEGLPPRRPALVLLRTPVARGTALVTLERDGLAWAAALPLAGYETRVEIPPGVALPPSAWMYASVVVPEQAGAEPPSLLSTRMRMDVAQAPDALQIRATLPGELPPAGEPLSLDLEVRDPQGSPTRAALFVHAYPAAGTRPHRGLGAGLQSERGPGLALRFTGAHLARSGPQGPEQPRRILGGFPVPGGVLPLEEEGSQEPPEDPGVFLGPLLTNDRGRISLTLPLARRHRRHRLVILAADPTHPGRFGRHHRLLEAEPSLGLRAEVPSLLRLGDRTLFPVTLHNRTAHGGRVVLRVRSTGAPVSPAHHAVDLAAGERGVTHLRLRAASPGLARIQLGAWLGQHRNASEHRVIVLADAPASGLRDQMGALRGPARLPLSPLSDPRSTGWLTLTLARSPYLACRELLARLALAERPTLAGTALALLSLGLAREPAFRSQLAPWLDEASFRALGQRALSQLRVLRLQGGRFRRYLGGPPANLEDVGLALVALEEAQASGLPLPAELASFGQDRLQALGRDESVPVERRTLALAILRASRQFLRPASLASLARSGAGLSPEAQARLSWVLASVDPGGRSARPQRPLPAMPRSIEARAFGLLAQAELGADPAGLEAAAHSLFESLAGLEKPWELAWSLLALRSCARRPEIIRTREPLSLWVNGRFLGSVDPRKGEAGPLHRSIPLEAGLAHEAVLGAPRTGWTYYHARLQAPPDRRHAHRAVSLWASYEAHRGKGPQGAFTPKSRLTGGGAKDPLALAVGDTAVGRITLVTTESLGEAVLRVPLPAGARLVDAGRPGVAPDLPRPWRHRFPSLPVLEITQQSDALFLQLDALPPGIHEHRWVIQATLPGRFRCEPATLQRSTDDRLMAVAAPCEALQISRQRGK